MRTVLFTAAFDSQLKWCAQIRTEFEQRGFTSRVVVADLRTALSNAQVVDAGFPGVERTSWEELITIAAASDVVVSALSGPSTRRLSIQLARRPMGSQPSPVIISGWVGIIIENITGGYLDRCGTDIIAVNSATDLDRFRDSAERVKLPVHNLLFTGLPFLSAEPQEQRSAPIRTVLFADQPTVPAQARERLYVYTKLLQYAEAHPDRTVLLKPRHRPGEDTFHRMKHHPNDLLRDAKLPTNFAIDYTPIREVIGDVDLLLTMSSTACLEAIDAGTRVGLILDLGVHEKYGNHVFLESGLLRTFGQIGRDDIGVPDPGWLAGYFPERTRSATQLMVDRAEELLVTGERPSHQVWTSDYFTSATDFHLATSTISTPVMNRYLSPSLRRRLNKHGHLKGLATHTAYNLLPPVLAKPARRAARKLRVL